MIKYVEPTVKLIDYTNDSERKVATAARNCYTETPPSELDRDLNEKDIKDLVSKILEVGHYSVLEHTNFIFAIECSRVTSHQLVRKRIGASYSQKSERYVDSKDFEFIMPPSIKNNEDAKEAMNISIDFARVQYDYLTKVEKIPYEDARYLLPRIKTDIVVSYNARSLYDFLSKRCCLRAQWEIRALANLMLKQVKEVSPLLFSEAGAPCVVKGVCPEGDMSCGRLERRESLKLNR